MMPRPPRAVALDAPVLARPGKAARRLAREHNSPAFAAGHIYMVDLHTGKIGEWVNGWAAQQITEDDVLYGDYALLRIGHGRMSMAEAQRFINEKGKGW